MELRTKNYLIYHNKFNKIFFHIFNIINKMIKITNKNYKRVMDFKKSIH
jgi:hypothetical protein